MKSKRTIAVAAKDVEKIINDLSILVVSIDRIGSRFHDKPRRRLLEKDKFFSKVNVFKLLSDARGILNEAYNAQSSEAEVAQSEEEAESLPYWRYKK